MRSDPDIAVKIATGGAVIARLPFAADANGLAVVDAQGREHCGEAIASQEWHPQLDQLVDDGFRIIILSEPLSGPLGPIAAGVAVCAPGEAVSGGLRLRETATAYKVKERKRPAPDSEKTLMFSGVLTHTVYWTPCSTMAGSGAAGTTRRRNRLSS